MATAKRGGRAKKTTPKKAAPKKAAARPVKKGAPKKAAARPVKRAAAKKAAPRRARAAKPAAPAYHTITPSLVFKGEASAAIDWYKKAFGAEEKSRMTGPDGKAVWHAEIKIGDSSLFMNDESPMGTTVAPSGPKTATASIQLFVPDVDAWAARAVEAGAKVVMPVGDMFWGDRMGAFTDPFGHPWLISTRVKHLTEAEMQEAAAAFIRSLPQQGAPPPEQA